ncbi:MAG: hypothetical protein V1760_00375 [Candidatus Peregrinibacteria bacterium]
MSLSLIFFIVIHIFALAFFMEALRRIHQRTKEYPLEDTSETIPFGLVRLRHVVFLYILIYLAWLLISFWLYFQWMDGGVSFLSSPSDTILNL